MVKLDRRNVSARVELAQLLIGENSPAAALDVIRQAPEDQHNLLPVVAARIWATEAAGNDTDARAELDQKLAAGARFPQLIFIDAVMKLRHKDFAGAQKSAEEVLTPNSPGRSRAAHRAGL